MKNRFLFFYFFSSIIICKDFDLLMSVYSDVYDNSVVFHVTPHPEKRIIERQPISFSFLLEDDFLVFGGDKSYMRVPDHFKDSVHLEGIPEFAGKTVQAPSKIQVDPLPGINSSIYDYTFNMPQDSMVFKSKDFDREERSFQFQFFSIKRFATIPDSINLKIDFYLPNLDSIDIKYYPDYSNKNKFKKLSQNKIKRNGEPIFSTFIKLPSSFKFNGAAGLEVSYKNSENKVFVDIINDNKKEADIVSDKQRDIPVIILATIVGIMVIFIAILVGKEVIRSREV